SGSPNFSSPAARIFTPASYPPTRGGLRRRGPDVLIDAEQIFGVVRPLDGGQSIVVVAVARPDALLALIHHHVHVRAAGGVGVKRLVVIDAPAPNRTGVRRVRIDSGEDRAPARVAIAPGRVGGIDVVRRAVDRIHVH